MAAPRCTRSLREYIDPLFSREIVAVEEHFHDITNIGGASQIILNPQPLDNVEYINDEGEVRVYV